MRFLVAAFLCGGLALSALGALLLRRVRARDRSPAAALRAFLRRLIAQLRRSSPEAVELVGFVPCSFTAILRLDGQDTAVPLHRLAQRAQVFPDAFPRLVQQLLDEARVGTLDRAGSLRFAAVATKLVPQVLTESRLAERSPRFGDEALPTVPLGADLVAVLAIQRGELLTYVNHGLLREWQRDFDGLFRMAVENLRRRTIPVLEPSDPTDALVVESGDGLDAARILVLEPFRAQGARFAVPDRDLLWIGGTAAGTDRELERMVAERCAAAKEPLSPRLYRVAQGRIEFAEEPSNADQRGVPRIVTGPVVGASTSTLEPSLGSKPRNRSR